GRGVSAELRADPARRCDPALSRSPRGSRHQPRRKPAADLDNGRIERAARSWFLTSRLIEDVNDRFADLLWRLGRPADQVHHLLQRVADPLRCHRWVDCVYPRDGISQSSSNAVMDPLIPERRIEITKPLDKRARW